ncbi:MAG: membrane protein [Vicingaceae bacterium]|nr:MAG: membrane protein [Vicingaceae bacterium]
MDKVFKKWNIALGWLVWLLATIVYGLTVEPTVSFWDCGEFIATSFKLEVGHPPGAPLFLMIGRLFSIFADPTVVAVMINWISVLSSSFTIMFLFWTISHFALKIASRQGELTTEKKWIILGSAFVGSMAYTFTDSFWFSAVEGEVYAMSSLFTAVVFWAILKWENTADQPGADRWLILIAYLMGLSIGVHLLNLLAIPAIAFVYYFRKYEVTRKGVIYASIAAVVILGFIQYGIIPGVVNLGAKLELFTVNTLGLPFNSGLFLTVILIIGLIVYGLFMAHKRQNQLWHLIVSSIGVIFLGYSTYTMILIRSNANPPLDENNPENAFTLLSYLNREQYGDRPLIFGQQYNTPLDVNEPYVDGDPVYTPDKKTGKYYISDDRKKSIPNYDKKLCTIFPRMWSSQPAHIREYKEWADIKGKPVRVIGYNGQPETIYIPTFWENLKFFFKYQLGHMYFRYFMWNFVGRQNDEQGHGEINKGNWISGIKWIDAIRLGPQDKLPKSITENPAYNRFYFLPLILGLLGLFFQYDKNKKDWWVVMLLFFFTGIAIVIYLNQYPLQPRERDYSYAGSFYAFSIWLGLGVYALYELVQKLLNPKLAAIISIVASTLAAPVLMGAEGWDDHDRSNRYTARDFAKNYLQSCPPNAILFTNGDNDTFPLWYVQEVEEFRTDVRVVNLSLLNTDWYIEQMKRKAYESDPIPSMLPLNKYIQGTNDYLPVVDKLNTSIDVRSLISAIARDEKGLKVPLGNGKLNDFIPSKKLKLKVKKDEILKNQYLFKDKVLFPTDTAQWVDYIEWNLGKNFIYKNDLIMLDILANNEDFHRPVCYAITTGTDAYLGLTDYFQLQGLAYQLIPVKVTKEDGQIGRVNTEIMYDNLMNKFEWGGLDKYHVYMDENNRRMCMNFRNNFARLAEALIREGKKEKAIKVLDRCMEAIPLHNVPVDFFVMPIAEAYYKAGELQKGDSLMNLIAEKYLDEMAYYNSLENAGWGKSIQADKQQAIMILQRLRYMVNSFRKDSDFAKSIEEKLKYYLTGLLD